MSLAPRLLLAAAALIISTAGAADEKTKAPSTTQALMRQKLENAHGLLEGIVREDFALIAKNAEILGNVSRATTWHKLDDADFLHHAKSFQLAADYLLEQARAKNLEGVALGNMRVTMSCMQCHNFVRTGRKK